MLAVGLTLKYDATQLWLNLTAWYGNDYYFTRHFYQIIIKHSINIVKHTWNAGSRPNSGRSVDCNTSRR